MSTAPSETLKALSSFVARWLGRRNITQMQQDVLLREREFISNLRLERRRSTRSGRHLLLILLEGDELLTTESNMREVLAAMLLSQRRDTDVVGWFQDNAVMAMLCTEICNPPEDAAKVLYSRLAAAISDRLLPQQAGKSQISIHVYPDDGGGSNSRNELLPWPDLQRRVPGKKECWKAGEESNQAAFTKDEAATA